MTKKINPTVVFLTNIPAPYRERLHEELYIKLNSQYTVLYCNKIEPNRKWKFELGNYKKTFLPVTTLKIFNRFIHINKHVIRNLNLINPDVVITGGFGPSMLLAFLWTKLRRKKHIPFTDGTIDSESNLKKIHRVVRKFVFKHSHAFIGASNKSIELYKSYGVNEKKCFKSVLCVKNENFNINNIEKEYDLMFSGQFIKRKNPLFFIEVANKVKKIMGYCRVLILGDGPLKTKILNLLEKYDIEYSYPGFVQQNNLPQLYAKSKIFFFPTSIDPWGVVANEACASGLPVIVTPQAGCAKELVINKQNGYVLPLDIDKWVNYTVELLTNKEKYNSFAIKSKELVQSYTHNNSAEGIFKAVKSV